MPEDETPQSTPAEPANRPEPPPYRPDVDLIGYIEKGQKPPRPQLVQQRHAESAAPGESWQRGRPQAAQGHRSQLRSVNSAPGPRTLQSQRQAT